MDSDDFITRPAALRRGITDARLRTRTTSGDLVRVRRGVFADGEEWQSLRPDERYRMLVLAAAAARSSDCVVSHYSAAEVHRLPVLGPDRSRVHFTIARGGGKGTRTTVEHRTPLSLDDCVIVDGVLVTSPARTALDIACTVDFEKAVCVVESALRAKAVGLDDVLARMGRRNGIAIARRAIDFASSQTESIGESWSRVLMNRWPEVPPPRMQHEFRTRNGLFVARTDFDWDGTLVGEFDGLAKYESGARSLVAEKLRQDALTALGVHVVRWTWDDLRTPARLRRILADGFAIASR